MPGHFVNDISQRADIGLNVRCGLGAVLGDDFDDRRTNDDAVGNLRDRGGLRGGANTETDHDGQGGCSLQPGDGAFDADLSRLLQAGDARNRNIIDKPAGTIEDRWESCGVGRGRGEADGSDAGLTQGSGELVLLRW